MTQLVMLLGLNVSVVACSYHACFIVFEFFGPVETSLEIAHKGSPYSAQWGKGEKHGPAGSHYPAGKPGAPCPTVRRTDPEEEFMLQICIQLIFWVDNFTFK